jgi:putative SOS response-associated peptidase YedK
MCGRYTLSKPGDILTELGVPDEEQIELEPNYNVAPTQDVPIVRADAKGHRQVVMVRWGLIPFWAKDEKIGNQLINARGESVAEKPAYKNAFKRRRCLLLADGFFEWQKQGKVKQPFHIHLVDHRPFVMAGLWERWTKGEKPIESCTVITTDANSKVAELHDRMPVILGGEARDLWLDDSVEDAELLTSILRPYPPGEMAFTPVSRMVNSPKNNSPDVLRPMRELSLFAD